MVHYGLIFIFMRKTFLRSPHSWISSQFAPCGGFCSSSGSYNVAMEM